MPTECPLCCCCPCECDPCATEDPCDPCVPEPDPQVLVIADPVEKSELDPECLLDNVCECIGGQYVIPDFGCRATVKVSDSSKWTVGTCALLIDSAGRTAVQRITAIIDEETIELESYNNKFSIGVGKTLTGDLKICPVALCPDEIPVVDDEAPVVCEPFYYILAETFNMPDKDDSVTACFETCANLRPNMLVFIEGAGVMLVKEQDPTSVTKWVLENPGFLNNCPAGTVVPAGSFAVLTAPGQNVKVVGVGSPPIVDPLKVQRCIYVDNQSIVGDGSPADPVRIGAIPADSVGPSQLQEFDPCSIMPQLPLTAAANVVLSPGPAPAWDSAVDLDNMFDGDPATFATLQPAVTPPPPAYNSGLVIDLGAVYEGCLSMVIAGFLEGASDLSYHMSTVMDLAALTHRDGQATVGHDIGTAELNSIDTGNGVGMETTWGSKTLFVARYIGIFGRRGGDPNKLRVYKIQVNGLPV